MTPALTAEERGALLRLRAAERRETPNAAPSVDAARDERRAARGGAIRVAVYGALARRGLIRWGNGWRLTDAGRAAL